MKIIKLSILFVIVLSIACSAQKKISTIEDKSIIKINSQQYIIDKSDGGANIESLSNKFSNAKQSSPNLPLNVNLNFYRKVDLVQLTKICAKYISTTQLLELIKLKEVGLLIKIRSDIEGNIKEVGFFTGKNSILTVKQLEEIEKDIKKELKVVIKPEGRQLLQGSNFILSDPLIFFTNILKVK